MQKKTYFLLILPALIFSWFIATVFIDMMAVPLVFQTVSSRDEAASLGVQIFRRFNVVELILFASISLCFYASKIFSLKGYLLRFSYLGLFPIFYFSYLTDKIVHFNRLKTNEIDNTKLETIQASLDLYHHLYVRLDTLKIFLLLLSFILVVKYIKTYLNNIMEAK